LNFFLIQVSKSPTPVPMWGGKRDRYLLRLDREGVR